MAEQTIFLSVAPLVEGRGIKIIAAFTSEEIAQIAAENERGGTVAKIALFDSYAEFFKAKVEFDSKRDAALAKLTEEEKAILGL